MIKTKDASVSIVDLDHRLFVAYGVALAVYDDLGNSRNCVVTSGNDAYHKKGSKHYTDQAIDLRVWGFDDRQRRSAHVWIAKVLGRDFDVVDEIDHLHLEWDPK